MRAIVILAALFAAALLWPATTRAYIVYPDSKNPDNWIVVIEGATGDSVKFASLPPPFDTIMQTMQGPDRLSFRWFYSREQRGLAYITVDPHGKGTLTVEFSGKSMADGDSFGVAAVLVGKNEKPLHTFYARADVRGSSFVGGADRRRVQLTLERPPEWWKAVEAISFFYMRYGKYQELDDAEKWDAMRSVVEIFTKGEGTEQRQ
jgi:hypothetical protein